MGNDVRSELDPVEQVMFDEIKELKSAQRENDDRMLRIEKRGKFAPGGGAAMIRSNADDYIEVCKAVLPDDVAQRELQKADLVCESNGKTGLYQSVGLATASALWFKTAMAIQIPKYFPVNSRAAEQLEALTEALTIEQKASFNEATPSEGGYLVPTIIAGEVLRIIQDSGVVVSRARHIPMGSNDLRVPNEATGVSVYWADELAQTTRGEGTFGQNVLTAKRLSGTATASIEAIEDSVIGLIPYIQNVMAEKMGKELDQEALEGDGTNFTGLVAESGVNSVSTTTTDGESVSYLDLVGAMYAADESSVEASAAWFMHRKVMATIVALTDDQSRPIFQPSLSQGVPGQLLGAPVYTTSAISIQRTRGSNDSTSVIYYGDPQRMLFGDRTGLRFDVTDTGPNWEYYAVDMRLNGRWGFTVGTPAAFSKIVGATPIGT